MMSPMSAEATVVRNYIDWLLALPWQDYAEERHDIKFAEAELNKKIDQYREKITAIAKAKEVEIMAV